MSAATPDARAALLDSLDGPAWLVDAEHLTVQRANLQAAQWLGQGSPQALIGLPADSLLPTLEDAAFWSDVRSGGAVQLASELELAHPAGGLAQVVRRIVPLGQPGQGWLVQLRDISAGRRTEQERDTLLAELRSTLEATADGILVIDLQGRIRAFNRPFAALWSLPQTALAGRDDQAVFDWMRLCVLQPEAYQQRLDEINGQLLLTATDQIALLDGGLLERHSQPQWSQGRPIGRVHTFRLLNRRRLGAPREQGAQGEDPITGHPNRAGLVDAMTRAISRARDEGRALALLCVEYDHQALFASEGLSAIRTLRELDAALRSCVREPHLITRLGGARFGVLLRGAGEAAAEALARRLLVAARGDGSTGLPTDGLPLAVGIAAYPQAGLDADTLLAHAESALAAAWQDHAGPGWQVSGYGGDDLLGNDEPGRLRRLCDSVHHGQMDQDFALRYLPRVDTRSGRVRAVEALLRWRDAGRGEVQPAQFLPMAQRAGLGGALDDWVLERSVQQAARWRETGLNLGLNINIGAWQLAQPGYARRVAAVLEAAQWPAGSLEIDVTEASLRADPDAALANLQALRALGVRVVLDDFGADEASLALLRRFPLSAVKIDRSLMHGVPRLSHDTGLAHALIQLAQSLRLEVLVEGVETEAQRQFLIAAGCTAWQGFLCAPPLDASGLEHRARVEAGAQAANDEARFVPVRRPA